MAVIAIPVALGVYFGVGEKTESTRSKSAGPESYRRTVEQLRAGSPEARSKAAQQLGEFRPMRKEIVAGLGRAG